MKAWMLSLLAGSALLAAGIFLLGPFSHQARGQGKNTRVVKTETTFVPAPATVPTDRVDTIEIPPQATFSELMTDAGVSSIDATAIYTASRDVYDLTAIRAGKKIDLHHDPASGEFKELVYALNGDEELHVRKAGDVWTAVRETIDYEVKIKSAKGTLASSLYAAGMDLGLDERVVVELADVFQWTIDFAQDVRVGDTFSFSYEERYRDGIYVMPGDILVAEYRNAGVAHQAYHFKDSTGNDGYYDEKGTSLRKMFLKAPVSFKYITSGFTTGRRFVSAFNVSTGHRAIDYAAKIGTPIRATADGVVAFAGRDGPYGNKISVRHNATYTTNYCHQSRFAVKKGQHVVQGQIIGYVGTTGFSTGPHLHYEMVKNGVKINPMNEVFPGTDPIKEEDKVAFQQVIDQWKDKL
jgi:murein DD-endopeptidase MepM/ murein hydrolase activator NlpD